MRYVISLDKAEEFSLKDIRLTKSGPLSVIVDLGELNEEETKQLEEALKEKLIKTGITRQPIKKGSILEKQEFNFLLKRLQYAKDKKALKELIETCQEQGDIYRANLAQKVLNLLGKGSIDDQIMNSIKFESERKAINLGANNG